MADTMEYIQGLALAWRALEACVAENQRAEFEIAKTTLRALMVEMQAAARSAAFQQGAEFQQQLSRDSYTAGFVQAMRVACEIHQQPLPSWVATLRDELSGREAGAVADVEAGRGTVLLNQAPPIRH